MSSDNSVKVAVRVRPLVDSEKNRGCQSIVSKTSGQPQVVVNSGARRTDMFTYNYVFAPEDTQEMLYENAVKRMVLKLFDGYNVTILAYGQTGSGKTHTMGTTFSGTMDDEVGVIPRAIGDIFELIASMPDHDFEVNVSFVELYKEKLYDLLSSNPRDQSVVDIREIDGKNVIQNLTEKTVKDIVTTTNWLVQGSSDRAVGATAMNAQSSRSHAIFTITVQKVPKENPLAATIAKFHLVDLAGSERSKKTQAVGEQFKEGVNINKGLSALGNVISALGTGKENGHVPYRDSKLTRLLQDSLGGNSMTLMIACVSPADYNCDETISTLRYADRARKIKNKPVVNEDPKMAEINRLKADLQELRVKMSSMSAGISTVEQCKQCKDPPTKAELQRENREMTEKMQLALFEMAHRENVLTEYEETIESLNNMVEQLKQQIIQLDAVNTAEMSPEALKEYEEKVHMVTATILDLTQHLKERNDCIVQNSRTSDTFNASSSRPSLENSEEMTQINDNYIRKQTEYQEELREFKNGLTYKEKLHTRLIENQKHQNLNEVKAKMSEYEEMITKLEKEREELKAALRGKNGTVGKLSEERRKKVQQLETQIAEFKQKTKNQANLLKQHQDRGEQIKKLSNEIMEMKQNKVKLIKKMKAESDEFRQWKAQSKKELDQARAKGRKLESEVAKKDLLHAKKQIVLQRKYEESNAANKRLKEALLRVQKNKESRLANKGAPFRKTDWLNEEIELISSIVDVKQSHDQLIETRAELTTRLNKAKRDKDKDLIKQIEDDIEMHNAQITELRGKINANDLDAKIKSIQESYQSLPESRGIVKHLLNTLVESRNSFNTYFTEARDLKHTVDALEAEKKQMAIEFKRKLEEAQNEQNRLVEENLDKQSVLLKALTSEGSHSELIELLQKQLAEKDAQIEELKQSRLKRTIRPRIEETYELDDTLESIDEDDATLDPDWVKTPMHKMRRKTSRSVSQHSSENETIADAAPEFPPPKTKSKATKRSRGGCGCTKGCKEGQCGCRKGGNACTDGCGCATHKNCTNIFGRDSAGSSKRERSAEDDDGSNKENDDEVIPCTPQKKMCTEDVIAPYVYSTKKRIPIFTSKENDSSSSTSN